MALPSRDKTFALDDCRALLDKLDREIDRYVTAYNADDIEAMKDIAFNASVTAWHLCDWVFNDMTQAQCDTLKMQTLRDLQDHARTTCRAIHLCRQAATASKHWVVSQHPDADVEVVVTCEPSPSSTFKRPGIFGQTSLANLLRRWRQEARPQTRLRRRIGVLDGLHLPEQHHA